MIDITKEIRKQYKSVKSYAKERNINYKSLRRAIYTIAQNGKSEYTNIENVLKQDGFLKVEN
ncbi:hypothetical protein [Campylobacter pinnipediorum]|uniref:Uncharacterized protein n=1 Tax=Campylobacter pinnipediorum subsp. pinnipediorum TaxID=1660067 RepID=A0AAX0L8M9_9BACT|nr:hypothetical protein [Campylobacter pinnipediorum]OPA77224.1 hypothetical protein BFG04_03775 [Campylobacter pinnipediorum subsp. pinnipediorum]